MHYAVLAILEEKPPVRHASAKAKQPSNLDDLMEPYGESREWDFWMMGGRWTGLFDGYDAEKDPANTETCWLCGGHGKRLDGMVVANGCNGCAGTGSKVKWPTEWSAREADIIPVAELTEEHLEKFHAAAIEGYGWFSRERYVPWEGNGGKFEPLEFPPLEWLKANGKFAAVLDCHN